MHNTLVTLSNQRSAILELEIGDEGRPKARVIQCGVSHVYIAAWAKST